MAGTTGKRCRGAATLLALLTLAGEAGAEIRVVEEKGRYGIADSATGELLVRPRYRSLQKAGEDYFIAHEGDLAGVVDSRGSVRIPFRFSGLEPVGRGPDGLPEFLVARRRLERHETVRTVVGYEKKLLKEKGSKGVNTFLTGAEVPVYGRKAVTRREEEVGVIGPDGEVLVEPRYDMLFLTPVRGVFRVADRVGEGSDRKVQGLVAAGEGVLLPVEYDEIRQVREGAKGTVVATVVKGFREEEVELPVPSLRPPGDRVEKFRKDGLWGFRTGDGKELAAPSFEDAWDFKDGFARVKRGGKWGFLDAKGRLAVDTVYDYAWDFAGGRAKVRLPDGSTRHIDETGALVGE